MDSGTQRTRLKAKLIEQMGFLERSANSFDEGNRSEAIRLAVVVRVLVHDQNPNSVSLLHQLDVKHELMWFSADRLPPQVRPRLQMVDISAARRLPGGGPDIQAVYSRDLVKHPVLLDFDAWWTGPVMSTHDEELSRKDIVRTLADRDGGAHVDPVYAKVVRMLQRVPLRVLIGAPDPQQQAATDLRSARVAMRCAMRTIAEEVRLGYLSQLDIIDPERELTRPLPAVPQRGVVTEMPLLAGGILD